MGLGFPAEGIIPLGVAVDTVLIVCMRGKQPPAPKSILNCKYAEEKH